jgi:ABC-2 type transport system permease protein
MLASRSFAPSVTTGGGLVAYLRLELQRTGRNRRYLLFTMAFPVIIYVLYTAILNVGGPGAVDGLTWPGYFLVSMAAYGAMGAAMGQAAPIAIERRGGWVQQLRVTPLPGHAYVLAKVTSSVFMTVPALVLVVLAGRLVTHVDLGLAGTLAVVVALALGTLPFAALAVVLGYTLDADSAQGGMVLVYFLMAILGGLFAPLNTFPAQLATIGSVLPASHLAAIGRATAAGHAPAVVDVAVLAAWTVALCGLATWSYLRTERAARA